MDFTLASGTAVITAGETDSLLTIVLIDDVLDEENETLTITLSSPTNATLNANTVFTGTINDNDPTPSISFLSETSSGLEAATSGTLSLELSEPSGREITFSFAVDTVNTTATSGGVDFSLENDIITIDPGDSTTVIDFTVINDLIDEENESIIVELSDFTNVSAGAVTSHTYFILDNDDSPEDFTVGEVVTEGDPIVAGYWNNTNTGIVVTIPVDDANPYLEGGNIQVLMGIEIGSYTNIGSSYVIQNSDLGSTVDISINENDFEALPFYNELEVIYVSARITDIYGNATIGTPSSTTLTVDTTRPDAFTTGTAVTTGGNVYANYWNNTNTGMDVSIPVADDATLNGGTIQLQGAIGINSLEDVGSAHTITGGDINTTVVMSLTALQLEALMDFADNEEISLNTILTDAAGNPRNGTVSSTIFTIDQTSTTVSSVESTSDNKAYTIGDTINVNVLMDENIYVTNGSPYIVLETGDNDALANYTGGSGTDTLLFEYIVDIGDTSSDLGYVNTSAFNLNGATIRDIAGNELTTTLPDPGLTGSFSFNQDIVIDTEGPSCILSYPSDSLFRYEDGLILITATFSDSMDLDIPPTITIDLPETSSDIANAGMSMVNGYEWTYTLTQVDDINGSASVSITGRDKALNTLDAADVTGGTALRFDNTDPVFSATYPDTSSFINHKNLGWTLSENLESGTITFVRTNGPGTTVSAALNGNELLQGLIPAGEINNTNSLGLIDQTTYTIQFAGVDTAGNAGLTEVDGVFYDITDPSAALTYTHEYASADTVVRITATFSERMFPEPLISVDYAGSGDDISDASMTLFNDDSTTWIYDVTIPGGQANNGIATVSLTGTDLALNALEADSVSGDSVLYIDNSPPSVQISYSDSLTAEGDIVTITSIFSETMSTEPFFPQIAITYAGGTEVTDTEMDYVDDTTYTFTTVIPDANDGVAVATITAQDISGNDVTEETTTGASVLRVDNTHPVFTQLSPDSSAFINHTLIGYRLSETVESGEIIWTRRGGTPDSNSPHTVQLIDEELVGNQLFEDYTVTDPTGALNTLVSGTIYDVSWTAVDSAGKESLADTYVSTYVMYDTTNPTAALTYTHEYANADTVVRITATFSERMTPEPLISVDYAGSGDDISDASMTLFNDDSTTWIYDVTIPGGQANNGIAAVSLSGTDLALNALDADSVSGDSVLTVDNTAPVVTFVYQNLTQTNLENLGKGGDLVEIEVQCNEVINSTDPPTLDIQFADSTDDSIEGLDYFNTSQGDSVWTFQITLPDSNINTGIMTVDIIGKDRAGNDITTLIDPDIFTVDNTPPADYATGDVIPRGFNQVLDWINGRTDTVEVVIPMIVADLSEHLDIEMSIPMKMGDTWVTIGEADSIQQAGTVSNYRSMDEVSAALNAATTFAQGDTIIIRSSKFDAAGNRTIGDQSLTSLIYDPNSPSVGAFLTDTLFTTSLDTIVSSDTLVVGWNAFVEPSAATASGLDYYEYAVQQLPDEGLNSFIDWSTLTDTSFTEIQPLVHDTEYTISVRAIDVAGNISDTLSSDPIRRWNSAPIITQLDSLDAFEDLPFIDSVDVSDVDFLTLLGDQLTYSATTTRVIGDAAIDSVAIDEFGRLSWTPTQDDTGSYAIEVIVQDNWSFADTMIFALTVHAVNDTPTVAIVDPDDHVVFAEDHTDTVQVNLTQYAADVDNDSTEMTWQAVVLDSVTNEGYPLGRVFPGPGTTEEQLSNLRRRFSDQSGKSTRTETTGRISVVIDTTGGVHYATFDADSNFFGEEQQVIFYVNDPDGAEASDTMLVTVTPANDPPLWTEIPRFIIAENDSFYVDFAEFVTDVDDTLLTFAITSDRVDTLIYSIDSYQSTGAGDSVMFKPVPGLIASHDSAHVTVIAADPLGSADTVQFTVEMIRIPRPHLSIAVIQNNAFSKYFEVIVTDTMGTTVNPILRVQEQRVELDTVSLYTYAGHHDFGVVSAGTYTFACSSYAIVGDTAVSRQVGLTLAKIREPWNGSSPDGLFRVAGTNGTVDREQTLLIVDSTMFNPYFSGEASYCIGNELMSFEKPVRITVDNSSEDLALYQRRHGSGWVELPSVTENGFITAYTAEMGYFRLGEKTLIVPENTSIQSNYPNPFNPVTTIVYDVGFSQGPEQHVELSVYNLLGQKVITLVDGKKSIGRHSIQWRGVNTFGQQVSSGIYFVQLLSSSGTYQTQKVMLIR